MGLLQPWLLALGLGAAIPLLLHLLQRHQGPRVIFPAVRYLRRAERESARKLKLRQWLLMLLRVALVLLIALAAARPFLLGGGSAHEPTAVVIVLDNSMSTGLVVSERRVLDELRERALETLERAGPDDRFWLLRAASPQEPALAGDAITTARRVRETQATSATADLPAALERARAILASSAGGRAPEIQLLTDLQASELRGVAGDAGAPPLVVWGADRKPPVNGAVTGVEIAGGIAPLASARTQLAASLGGSSDSTTVRLFAFERLVASVRAPGDAAALLTLPASAGGLVWGRVERDADELHADDQRFFVTRVLPPPVVRAVAPSSFLAQALAVLAAGGRVRNDVLPADVLVLSHAEAVPPIAAGSSVVIVPPANAVQLPALNRQLASARIPWSFAPTPQGGETQFAPGDSTDALERSLARVRLTQTFALRPSGRGEQDTVLLRTRAGEPWAVRGLLPGGGRYIVLGSPLDSAATDIPTSAAMIPLLDRIFGAWSSPSAERLEARPGDVLALPAGTERVRRPDGATEDAADGRYGVPPLAGVYRVFAGDSLLSAFAVNAAAAESDLTRLPPDRLESAFERWPLTHAGSAREWQRAAFRARLGLQLWRPLLYALLALLLVEAFAAATGGRRGAALATAEEN